MLQGGLALTGLTAMFAAIILLYLIPVIASWKIYQKAGIAGWKSLVPVYNLYLIYKIAGMSGWWVVFYYVAVILSNCWENTESMPGWATTCVAISGLIAIIGQIIKAFKLPKVFGKGIVYSILSIFFPRLVELVLGFGSSKYEGDYTEK